MAGIVIDHNKCVGCGLCVKACAADALAVTDKKAMVDRDACVLCGVCVDTCPFKAITLEREEAQKDLSVYTGIWVIAQELEGELAPVTLELLGKGRELAEAKGVLLSAVLLTDRAEGKAARLMAAGADQVYLCCASALKSAAEDVYYNQVAWMAEEHKPEIMLFGATNFGRSIAPRIASRLKTGLTADCTILRMDPDTGLLQQTRPAFGGNLMATIICPNSRPQMATVRPGVMQALQQPYAKAGKVIEVPLVSQKTGLLQLVERVSAGAAESIADARIILTAGKGIGSKKNVKLLQELASHLGAAVGVTRPLVDAGWSEYQYQIGQTGCSVAPKLLITFGVSGAIQHLAGIGNAEMIVAINTDPEAPIFGAADYGIVGDCVEVLKAMLAEVRKG